MNLKKYTLTVIFALSGFIYTTILGQTPKPPFQRGVNLTMWFQTSNVRQIQFTKFTKKDFENIQSLGADAIRLPIDMTAMTKGSPDYTVDPLLYTFLDQAVDWAEELGIHLIIDNHTNDATADTPTSVGPVLVKIWKQIAAHYKGRTNYISYEIRNEPHGITAANWNTIQQNVIDAIRSVDTKHAIVVGGVNWNSYNDLKNIASFADTNLIYTFHFYDPFVFTHQGASWANPSMVPLQGVPFPYDAGPIPPCPNELKGTWIEYNLNDYANIGTPEKTAAMFDTVTRFVNKRNVKVWCGELGVFMNVSPPESRVNWYGVVRKALEDRNIAWTMWDYTGGFGLFNKGSSELFGYDLNIPLVSALGFNIPEQKTLVIRPDTVGFTLYDEAIAPNFTEASGISGTGILDYYNASTPADGNFCLYVANAPLYNQVAMKSKPTKDMTTLLGAGYALDFWVRGPSAGTTFSLRFIDTKTGENDHPWRMEYKIDGTKVTWNGQWQHVHVPLGNFYDAGSWDDAWFNPEGKFDWSAVDLFTITADPLSFEGKQIWFDNIRVLDTMAVLDVPTVTGLNRTVSSIEQFSIFPNPAESVVNIAYTIASPAPVDVSVYNSLGKKVASLVHKEQTPGTNTLQWPVGQLERGFYFCRLTCGDESKTSKILLLGH